MNTARFVPLLLAVLLCAAVQAQSPYSYNDLSSICYRQQKDSLKKAWVCPDISSDKQIQKKFKEIWKSRTSFVAESIDDNSYLNDPEITPYIQEILTQISAANKDVLPTPPLLLLDRSPSANAYALGNNVVAVNIGLVSFVQSREELALVLAHEISHNILNHGEKAMRQHAEWLESGYKSSLNGVLDSKYERLTRLQEVFTTYSFSRNRHQRYSEEEADALAIVLLKKSKIGFSADFFLRLDSADMQLRQPLKKDLGEYFTGYRLPFDESWTKKASRGLSTRNHNFSDTTQVPDSLKTHPDCYKRYKRTKSQSDASLRLTPLPDAIHARANKAITWYVFTTGSLTSCAYRILIEKDKGNEDPWYDFMLHNVFAGLLHADRRLKRFNAVGIVPKEQIAHDYYKLQTLFEQMSSSRIEEYCKLLQGHAFWQSLGYDESQLKKLIATIVFETDENTANESARELVAMTPQSMYRDFAEKFIKK